MMQLAGEIKAVVSLKPVSTPHLTQLVCALCVALPFG
jgi:hypothetical protein